MVSNILDCQVMRNSTSNSTPTFSRLRGFSLPCDISEAVVIYGEIRRYLTSFGTHNVCISLSLAQELYKFNPVLPVVT